MVLYFFFLFILSSIFRIFILLVGGSSYILFSLFNAFVYFFSWDGLEQNRQVNYLAASSNFMYVILIACND